MSEAKKQDEKSVFDGSEFGIGHNRGPKLDDPEAVVAAEAEAESNVDTDTQHLKRGRRSSAKLSKEAIAWLRAKEKSGELEKVTWDSRHGSEAIEAFEMRQAGPSRAGDPCAGEGNEGDCKWRNPDGLVSRRGYRRNLPHPDDRAWLDENNIDALQQTARRVLHGRNATIFQKHVINPLIGLPKVGVEELAAQFGIAVKRVYKILDWSKKRVKRALRGEPPPLRLKINRPVRWTEVREQINETQHIDFLVDEESGIWVRASSLPEWAKPKEPMMEKWQSEEQERIEKIRNQIKLQREARDKKGKPNAK